jgi:hypothetical protein
MCVGSRDDVFMRSRCQFATDVMGYSAWHDVSLDLCLFSAVRCAVVAGASTPAGDTTLEQPNQTQNDITSPTK